MTGTAMRCNASNAVLDAVIGSLSECGTRFLDRLFRPVPVLSLDLALLVLRALRRIAGRRYPGSATAMRGNAHGGPSCILFPGTGRTSCPRSCYRQGPVAEAVAAGEITPDEGQAVAAVLETQRRAIETSQLEQRLAALEARQPK